VTSLKGLHDLSTANFQYAEWRKPSMPLRPVMVGRTGNSPRSHSRKILDNPASSRWPLRSSVNRRHGTTNWKTLDVTAWLIWFAQTVLTEQRVTHGHHRTPRLIDLLNKQQNSRENEHQTLRMIAQHRKLVYTRRTLRVNSQQRIRVNYR
jgi:hypothetical protein